MTGADYRTESRWPKTARAAASGEWQEGTRPEALAPCPADLAAVEEFLQLLARAVRQVRTYPSTSARCTDAVAACHAALASLDGRDELVLRVTSGELCVDDTGVGADTLIEHELVRRLHRAHVAGLTVDRAASPRDLSRFCSDVIRCHQNSETNGTLAELLAEHGVDTITPRMVHRPEVFDIGVPSGSRCDLVERERSRREALLATGGSVTHLYPPDKGGVRLDPAASFSAISLVDLAILLDDPAEVATVLSRLSDDETGESGTPHAALEHKFSDVATLFASLDPRLARLMFAKLARAVLELDPAPRERLLRRTVLPGLLDGRVDGAVLKDFPDVNLAESLCLLLDLETAVPEVVTAALDRLELPDERRRAVAPLLEERLRERQAAAPAGSRRTETGLDRYAQRLIRVNAAPGRSFTEFAAFDLSMDGQTAATIEHVREAIGMTDVLVVQLECLSSLVRLEPNPARVDAFLQFAMARLAELEGASRWREVASWAARFRRCADALQESRPDVADTILAALEAFCTTDRAARLVQLYESDDDGRGVASTLVEAFGVDIAPAFVALLEDRPVPSKARALLHLMCEHANRLAPALVTRVGHGHVATRRALVRVLGFAGPGYEAPLTEHLGHRDEQTVREALRALTRIGTPKAAAVVAAQVQEGSAWVRSAAEEALWHFPPAEAQAQLRDLLGRRAFVLRHPRVAARLLDRAAQTRADGLEQVLVALRPLRFWFWRPAVVRVARTAGELLKR